MLGGGGGGGSGDNGPGTQNCPCKEDKGSTGSHLAAVNYFLIHLFHWGRNLGGTLLLFNLVGRCNVIIEEA